MPATEGVVDGDLLGLAEAAESVGGPLDNGDAVDAEHAAAARAMAAMAATAEL